MLVATPETDGGDLVGHDKNQRQTTMESGRSDSPYQGVGSQGKGQGQQQGQGLNQGGDDTMSGGWKDQAQREMQQGDRTRPAQPDSTAPLDKDEHPINKTRPVQQNR